MAEEANTLGTGPTIPPYRPPRRNLNRIHALPLPLRTYPVPAFHPTNPLSILYVIRTFVGPYIFPAFYSSHAERHIAYISTASGNIVVTDPDDIRALWERGFFGKGSLSRSEPEWLEKEKKRTMTDAEGQETSEEVTRLRREARREEKRERARREREEIEVQLRNEGKLPLFEEILPVEDLKANGDIHGSLKTLNNGHGEVKTTMNGHGKNISNGIVKNVRFEDQVSEALETKASNGQVPEIRQSSTRLITQEHLQLMPEEAFFLVYGLGILDIFEQHTERILTTYDILERFRTSSYFPPATPQALKPDDPFLISYVVYHHFRSLGWVVRSGIKFAADWLLYYRGPAFSHAEFAVFVVPSYSDPYWSATPERIKQTKAKATKNWWWLHAANRVQGHVKKTPVLVYVEIPPPLPSVTDGDQDIGALLRSYRVNEFSLKRWTANRNRKAR